RIHYAGENASVAKRDGGAHIGGSADLSEEEKQEETIEIVGIVPGTRHALFEKEPAGGIYLPFARGFQSDVSFFVRFRSLPPGNESTTADLVRRTVRDVDPSIPIISLRTFAQHLDANLDLWLVRAGAALFSIFGGLALGLAVVGLYGVKAYSVARRTREIGIRMALGAKPTAVLRLIMAEGLIMLLSVIALGLLLAAATGKILSAANALLLRPLPVEDIDSLVVPVTLREGFDPFGSPFLEYAAYRDRAHCFASSGVATARSFNLTGRGEPERVRGATVMANYLSTLGTKPVLGRTFSADDDRLGVPPVALISYGLWQKHFGSNADVISQSLNLDGRSYNVIGVMPPGFDVPGIADVWVPLQVNIDTLPLIERAATNNT